MVTGATGGSPFISLLVLLTIALRVLVVILIKLYSAIAAGCAKRPGAELCTVFSGCTDSVLLNFGVPARVKVVLDLLAQPCCIKQGGCEKVKAKEIIKLDKLSHTYIAPDGAEVLALDNISLNIAAGSFVAVIGCNGSGKSTLAKHLNALLLPSSGKCLIEGFDTADQESLWSIRQKVGMVFQNPDNQIVAAIVEEDVAFGPENLGVPSEEIAGRVAAALAAVGMNDYSQHGPHLLSGGQKQRVAIAGVLAMRSHCLVLDEPTAMLDPQGRREVLATVHQLNKTEKITVIYITHFMEEAVTADRVIVMDAGRIVADGTPAEIFSQVEKLQQLGLDTPVAAEVSHFLRKAGLSIPAQVITDKELVRVLCP